MKKEENSQQSAYRLWIIMKLQLHVITWQQIRTKQTLGTQSALAAYFLIKMDSQEKLGQAEQVETHGLSCEKKWQP